MRILCVLNIFIPLVFLASISACKKKEDEKTDNPKNFLISILINNNPTEFPEYKYYLTEKGNTFENNLIFSRGTKEKIHITFRGNTPKTYKIIPGDSTCIIHYCDLSGRDFLADSGAVDLSQFFYDKTIGKHILSGSFAFNANYEITWANPPYSIFAFGRNGAFVNLENN